MVKYHLKRLNAPKTWNISRKENTFITRPNPGPHSNEFGISLSTFLKYFVKKANSTKEVKYILTSEEVLVNGKRMQDYKHQVGFMDIISFPKTNEHFRISLDSKGRLNTFLIDKEESGLMILKIINKRITKGKLQLCLFNGRNVFVDRDVYKTKDSVIITVPKQEVKEHLKFEKGSLIFLLKGKFTGSFGTIEKIENYRLFFRKDANVYETKIDYALVVGKEKPVVKL